MVLKKKTSDLWQRKKQKKDKTVASPAVQSPLAQSATVFLASGKV
ncbi:hypothetical protein HMPREF0351_13080 (plasmid) [Enterococcus faecium DO]|uniref:Uncharacterized protein n=1 Tax=Enterococcus faecium (strain ATCC BAA-472 / TX0016 / DO) TaxID=333849 RepID=I3U6R6_ENTFD|nr:hypothetical protein HMPREF0351_13080 [Enterococcus faecium DO]